MKIETRQGYVWARSDRTAVYGNIIYLGKEDSASNYIELTIEEAGQLKSELEQDVNNDME